MHYIAERRRRVTKLVDGNVSPPLRHDVASEIRMRGDRTLGMPFMAFESPSRRRLDVVSAWPREELIDYGSIQRALRAEGPTPRRAPLSRFPNLRLGKRAQRRRFLSPARGLVVSR